MSACIIQIITEKSMGDWQKYYNKCISWFEWKLDYKSESKNRMDW